MIFFKSSEQHHAQCTTVTTDEKRKNKCGQIVPLQNGMSSCAFGNKTDPTLFNVWESGPPSTTGQNKGRCKNKRTNEHVRQAGVNSPSRL